MVLPVTGSKVTSTTEPISMVNSSMFPICLTKAAANVFSGLGQSFIGRIGEPLIDRPGHAHRLIRIRHLNDVPIPFPCRRTPFIEVVPAKPG